MPSLKNKKGLATNAVYGFTTMLRKLIADEKPDYLGVALDLEGPTIRHLAFERYKANRKVMPEDLAVQLPYIKRVCQVLRIPVLSYPQYEADDVIGTLATMAAQSGLISVIVSNDKDMYQLVSDRIFILDNKDGNQLIDANRVREKMGVPPTQVVDLLGLWGDASDNIPGAPGIGQKGARELIQQFGSIENCLQNYEKVQRKTYRDSLKNHADQIRQCRELVTIHINLPIELDLDELILSEPDRQAAYELFSELEFTSLLKAYNPASPASDAYKEITEEAEFSDLVKRCQASGRVGICVVPESQDFVTARPFGLAFSIAPHEASFVRWNGKTAAREAIQRIVEDPKIKKIYHDQKRAKLLLDKCQIQVQENSQDVMLAAYLLDPNAVNYHLNTLSQAYLGVPSPEFKKKLETPSPELVNVACERADLIHRVADLLIPKLQEQGLEGLYKDIELPLVAVLAEMEEAGVKIDAPLLAQMSKELESEIEKLTGKIYELAGSEFNINSSRQLGEVLFEKQHLISVKRTQKTKSYSTDSETLAQLAEDHLLPKLVLEYRQLSKLKSTYLDALPKLVHPQTGRVHTSYNQTGTATGRLSSTDPNFQNIPVRTELGRKIRSAIIAEEGCLLLSADYSQIELRIMAHLSDDPVLVEAFQKAEDIHAHTAIEVFGMAAKFDFPEYRRRAKVINFGIIYGQSAFGLAKQLKTSRPEAQKFINNYFARYRGVKRWLDSTLELAHKTGTVKTLFGRTRQIKDINSRDSSVRGFAERAAINSPIQGTAADLIKIAMINIHRILREKELKAKLILQVHDELVFEVPQDEISQVNEIVKYEMENVYPLKVPLVVDIHVAKNWRDLK